MRALPVALTAAAVITLTAIPASAATGPVADVGIVSVHLSPAYHHQTMVITVTARNNGPDPVSPALGVEVLGARPQRRTCIIGGRRYQIDAYDLACTLYGRVAPGRTFTQRIVAMAVYRNSTVTATAVTYPVAGSADDPNRANDVATASVPVG